MKNIYNRLVFGFGPKIEMLKNNQERLNVLEKAYEKGFRLFETAPAYCFGMSERILGQFYEKKKDIKIYTKFSSVILMPKVFEKSRFLIKFFRRLNDKLFYPYPIDFEFKNIKSNYSKSLKNIKTKPQYYLLHGIDRNLTQKEYLDLKYKMKDLCFDEIGFASDSINHNDFSFDQFDVIQTGIESYYKFMADKIPLENKKIILYSVYSYYLKSLKTLDYNIFVKKLLESLPDNVSIVMSSTNLNTIEKWNFK